MSRIVGIMEMDKATEILVGYSFAQCWSRKIEDFLVAPARIPFIHTRIIMTGDESEYLIVGRLRDIAGNVVFFARNPHGVKILLLVFVHELGQDMHVTWHGRKL